MFFNRLFSFQKLAINRGSTHASFKKRSEGAPTTASDHGSEDYSFWLAPTAISRFNKTKLGQEAVKI